MKKTLSFLLYLLVSLGLYAVPAKPIIKTLTQPDGSIVEARLVGDENHHYYTTLDGEKIDYSVQSTEYRVQSTDNELNSKKRVHPSTFNSQFSTFNLKRAPHQAERGLVILVEFKDLSFTKTRQNFDDLLNKDGYNYNGATGSAMNYFKDASNGQYVPSFDVFGPYKLDRNMSYYGQNDASDLDMHPDQMVVDAIAKLAADKTANVNFADYDTDNDGYIDNIFVYYAGYGENEGAPANTIWPHAWEVYDEYVTGQLVYNGKTLKGYACTSELQGINGSTMCGIGTFCHEFSHVLGLPDWYVTDYSSTHKTPGDWDLMDAGAYLNDGNTPPTYSAHERFYLGWLTPEILNVEGEFELEEIQKSNKAYIITSSGTHNLDGGNPNPKTYFLLENRQNTGWDRYLPGHGLMISKTVYDEDDWSNNIPNNSRYSQGYDIIEADGKAPNENYGKPGDLFPGTSNVTSYSPYAQYPITNIAEVGDKITFSFMKSANENPDDGDDDNNGDIVFDGDCFEETFDGLVENSSADITDKMDDYADNSGWSGYKLFGSSGALKVGSSKHKGYVITPSLPFEGEVNVEFIGRGYNSADVINFEIDGKVVNSANVDSRNTTVTFKLHNFVKNSSIKIYANTNRFYVDNIKICVEKSISTTINIIESDIYLIANDDQCQILNLPGMAELFCYDISGRMLWSTIATGNYQFKRPSGFYLIRVVYKDEEYILKGL